MLAPSDCWVDVLLDPQVTTHSTLVALAYETRGILIDDGWLGLLGSGHPESARPLSAEQAYAASGFEEQIVTTGAEEIISLYERHAAAWVRARDAHHFTEAQWIKRFQELLPPACAILDLGCGSGRPIARHFIKAGFEVVGVDSSPSLIESCRVAFPNQQWVIADMRTLSLNRKFQGIVAWDSFFHLSHNDQRAMFEVFRDHAADGAALIFTTGPAHGESPGLFEGELLYHASLSKEEYQKLLAAHGFRVLRYVIDDPECGGHTVWLAQSSRSKIEAVAGIS